jgi:hypothetical protein
MLKKALIVALSLTALSACGGSNSSLAGIDNDHNGIRDDIDAYIKEKYKDELQKKAVQQFARNSQLKLVVNLEDEVALQESSNEADRATTCVYKTFESEPNIDASDVIDEIGNMTTNTKKRLQAYHKYSDALDGFVFTIPQRDYCDK